MITLTGQDPATVLPHGPSKRLVKEYLWHSPHVGVVATYTPNERDVKDHFGVFRAVDQVESFGQAVVVSCSAFLESRSMGLDSAEYYKLRNFVFAGIKSVRCHGVIRCNESYVCLGVINFFKCRLMTASGRIYKAPEGIDLKEYFRDFSEERLRSYDLDDNFILTTELNDMASKGISNEILSSVPLEAINQ
jgi:hypothetical protein